MNKQEAISAMQSGKKVTHRYFSDNEWMTQQGQIIILEDGVKVLADEFWSYRTSEDWNDDYELFNEVTA